MKQKHEEKKLDLIDKGLAYAAENNYLDFTKREIARHYGMSEGTINYYFYSIEDLREAIIDRAVETENLIVLAQAMAYKHPKTRTLSEDLMRRIFSDAQQRAIANI